MASVIGRLRWKMVEKTTGLASVTVDNKLRDRVFTNGIDEYVRVSCLAYHRLSSKSGWYFYGNLNGEYINTCHDPVETENEAKEAAKNWAIYQIGRVKDGTTD